MSVEATWDLRTNASPRSLCVFAASALSASDGGGSGAGGGGRSAAGGGSSNPFDAATSSSSSAAAAGASSAAVALQSAAVVGMVFGTDAGSLHYRAFGGAGGTKARGGGGGGRTIGGAANTGGLGSGIGGAATSSSTVAGSSPSSRIQVPLGYGSTTAQQQQSLPRSYHPIDLVKKGSLLPGSVVDCLPLGTPHALLVLCDDHRATANGAFAAKLVTLHPQAGGFHFSSSQQQQNITLPRMSCAAYHPSVGVVYAAGRTVTTLPLHAWEPEVMNAISVSKQQQQQRGGGGYHHHNSYRPSQQHQDVVTAAGGRHHHPHRVVRRVWAYEGQLPAPGCRSGRALQLSENGTLAVVAVDHSFYAIPASRYDAASAGGGTAAATTGARGKTRSPDYAMLPSAMAPAVKILSLTQSPSQVHPVVVLDAQDASAGECWSCWFLANGRECAVIDVYYDYNLSSVGPSSAPVVRTCPRQSTAVLASPIVSAAASWPWLVVLTSDGMISIRSPSCVAIPLQTVEVGQQPNDYFVVVNNNSSSAQQQHYHYHPHQQQQHVLLAASYSGEAKVVHCRPDTKQDLADRLMRLSIDALGDAFPRQELALALHASFVATSYVSATATASGIDSATGAAGGGSGNNNNANSARLLLQHYLEAVLGLVEWDSGGVAAWPTEMSVSRMGGGEGEQGNQYHVGTWQESAKSSSSSMRDDDDPLNRSSRSGLMIPPTVVSADTPAALLTGSALLCLVCLQLTPPNASLANRAAKACAEQLGVIISDKNKRNAVNDAAVDVCEQVADKLLREASSTTFSLISGSSPTPVSSRGHRQTQTALYVDFIEACIWLLRACGRHERALEVAYDKLCRQTQPTMTTSTAAETAGGSGMLRATQHGWSQIKYESYTATHLSELWGTQSEAACQLVLKSPATHRLLEKNPRLGLSVFTSVHPQNEAQWRVLRARDNPLAHPQHARQVVQLLQSIHPCVPYNNSVAETGGFSSGRTEEEALPLDSGRNLAIAYLESAIGIVSGRPTQEDEFDSLPSDPQVEERIASFHDELSLLLLEGVIAERQQDDSTKDNGDDTELGQMYRSKLKTLLRWPLARVRSETFLQSLPPSFLQEKALVLGRLGRHEDALRILYRDLRNLDLALEYCDFRHEQLKAQQGLRKQQQQQGGMFQDQEQQYYEEEAARQEDNAYLPLVRVALEEDEGKEGENRGTAAAIQVLALRRSAIDRAAALRLLPSDIPVSAVARPFLIPALVDSESQVRRLTVVSALLRARYLRLKGQLTAAQLQAQAHLHVVPQLRSLNLGDPLHSTNPFRARTSTPIGSTMPDVMIVKYFFPRHLVIQAKVTNSVALNAKYARTLSDIAFVVAESSEEAIQPLLQVPIQVLPSRMTGCAWCVLSASPGRMDGPTAQLTCELRYTVQSVEASSASGGVSVVPPLSTGVMGRTYVEELQDLEVHAAHFS